MHSSCDACAARAAARAARPGATAVFALSKRAPAPRRAKQRAHLASDAFEARRLASDSERRSRRSFMRSASSLW